MSIDRRTVTLYNENVASMTVKDNRGWDLQNQLTESQLI